MNCEKSFVNILSLLFVSVFFLSSTTSQACLDAGIPVQFNNQPVFDSPLGDVRVIRFRTPAGAQPQVDMNAIRISKAGGGFEVMGFDQAERMVCFFDDQNSSICQKLGESDAYTYVPGQARKKGPGFVGNAPGGQDAQKPDDMILPSEGDSRAKVRVTQPQYHSMTHGVYPTFDIERIKGSLSSKIDTSIGMRVSFVCNPPRSSTCEQAMTVQAVKGDRVLGSVTNSFKLGSIPKDLARAPAPVKLDAGEHLARSGCGDAKAASTDGTSFGVGRGDPTPNTVIEAR